MPIYEYQCPKCQRVFEEWVTFSDAHGEEPCPDCGTSSPRIISHTSFVLKGGGWYVDDYGYRKGIKDEDSAPSSSSSSSSSSDSGTKDGGTGGSASTDSGGTAGASSQAASKAGSPSKSKAGKKDGKSKK